MEIIPDKIDSKLLEILVCPLTKGPLRYDVDARELITEQAGLAYPVRDGIPIMLVWGEQDKMFPVSHAYRASELTPAARLEVLSQCGHWPHMERASDFNSLALDFLSSSKLRNP